MGVTAHSFDALTRFCTKCGAHESMLLSQTECLGGGNVVGMSHRTIENARLEGDDIEFDIVFEPDEALQKAIDEAP